MPGCPVSRYLCSQLITAALWGRGPGRSHLLVHYQVRTAPGSTRTRAGGGNVRSSAKSTAEGGPGWSQLNDQTNTRTTMRRSLQHTAGLERPTRPRESQRFINAFFLCVCVCVRGCLRVRVGSCDQNTGASVSEVVVHFHGRKGIIN